jgi:hypothetical protein
VCFDASAATMEAPDALLSGGTAAEVVDCLISLADDSTRRQKLVTAGFVALSHNFNPDREDERVLGAIDHLCGWPRDSEAQPRVS